MKNYIKDYGDLFVDDILALRDFYDKNAQIHGVDGNLSLKFRPGFENQEDGIGSLLDEGVNRLKAVEKDYSQWFPWVDEKIVEIGKRMEARTRQEIGTEPGRLRFLRIQPKRCLSYHIDLGGYRFHVPIHTFHEAFFVVNDTVCRMPFAGHLYSLETTELHTAVNSHLTYSRVHLVLSSSK